MMLVQPRAALLTEIANFIDAGQLKTNVQRVFPLAEARQAQELSQQGHTRGKIVLQRSQDNKSMEPTVCRFFVRTKDYLRRLISAVMKPKSCISLSQF